MLLSLHVKNLALIEEAELEFGEGFNILTGETGAGKSILIGSVGIALGGKASKDLIRQGEENAYIELVFSVDDEKKKEALKKLSVYPDEDGLVIVSKRITRTRSIGRINEETITTSRLKEVTALLLDLHGQQEHQTLLHSREHLKILDEYSRNEISSLKDHAASEYHRYQELNEQMKRFSLDEEQRKRELDFLSFEINEIEASGIRPGEEKELTEKFRRFSNARKIMEALSATARAAENDELMRAMRDLETAASYDETVRNIYDQAKDAENILEDLKRSVLDYQNDMEFDGEELRETEERLDVVRRLMAKYGSTEEEVLQSLEKKKARFTELENFEELSLHAEKERKLQEARLSDACEALSEKRKEASLILEERIAEELRDLNFLHVDFRIEVRRLDHYTAAGFDEVEFLISTNPGSIPPRPIGEVASGGELSRIMLAIKSVLADTDEIPTLIFDEIDTGISGRTAQKVSERLAYLARRHQVLCITHLPQIAAMADVHFEISKTADDGRAVTKIRKLDKKQQIEELARLLGGVEITSAVRKNAAEMKRFADETKQKMKIHS